MISKSSRSQGVLLALSGSASSQFGVAIGALAFPVMGFLGVVSIRQLVAAGVFLSISRPRWRTLRATDWLSVGGLALVLSLMNIATYAAIERIGMGLTFTIGFLGPLSIAVLSLRRGLDFLAAAVAAAGVVLLIHPSPTTDVFGIFIAALGGLCWIGYILINRTVGARFHGVEGLAVSGTVSALFWVPFTIFWFLNHVPPFWSVCFALACGVLASVVPFAFDHLALKRISAGIFSLLTSSTPVFAALVGWAILGQRLGWTEWFGLGLVVASNAVIVLTSPTRS